MLRCKVAAQSHRPRIVILLLREQPLVSGVQNEAQVAHQDWDGAEEGCKGCLYHHFVEGPLTR